MSRWVKPSPPPIVAWTVLPPTPAPPRTTTPADPSWGWRLALIASAALLPGLVDGLATPAFGESLALRWARSLASHPVRGALAAALLVWPAGRGGDAGPGGRAGPGPPEGL